MLLPLAALTWIDAVIVGVYALVVLLIGHLAQARQTTSKEFLLGNKQLPAWLLAASLFATSFSTIALLSITGDGYRTGFLFAQLWIGELIAAVIVIWLFLPFYARLKSASAYAFLEERLGVGARRIASILFHVVTLARGALLLFLAAEALSTFTALGTHPSILIVGGVAVLYSARGGLGAVVWTDALQLAVIIIGVGASFVVLLSGLDGGLAALFKDASAASGRPVMPHVFDVAKYPSLLSSIVPYVVILVFVGGTNQQPVQRYLAAKDLATSRRAVLGQWFVGTAVVLVVFALGAGIHARFGPSYVVGPDGKVLGDRIFTTFIATELPTGLAGLLVAAIFAASMSSIDSAIHALGTATLVDFVEPLRGPIRDERQRLRRARLLTAIYGVLVIGAALIVAGLGLLSVFQSLIGWLAFFAGPVLALFLLAMLRRRPRQGPVLIALAAGLLLALAWRKPWLPGQSAPLCTLAGMHGIWSAVVGLVATIGLAIGLDRMWPQAASSEATKST